MLSSIGRLGHPPSCSHRSVSQVKAPDPYECHDTCLVVVRPWGNGRKNRTCWWLPHHSPWIRHRSCYFHDFILFLPESLRIPQWIFQKIAESVQDFWQTERDWYTLQYVHIAKIWKPYRRPAEGLSGCLVGRPPALVLLCRQRGV